MRYWLDTEFFEKGGGDPAFFAIRLLKNASQAAIYSLFLL